MPGIRIHPKYGVNPTIPLCAWCGEPKNEVVLLGAAYRDEAPMHMCINDEPCEKCQSEMDKGITFIEAKEGFGGKAERTGKWCVVKEDAVRGLLRGALLDDVLQRRSAYLTPELWAQLGLDPPE